jgi:hypothetical protein
MNSRSPHQIKDPLSHRRKIDIEDSERPVEIEDDSLDGVK